MVGIIENMAGMTCPHCGKDIDLFKIGGGEKAAKDLEVPFLGRVPIDLDVVNTGDEGLPIIAANPDSPAARAFNDIIEKVIEFSNRKDVPRP